MKAVREYQTKDNELICLVSFVPDEDDLDLDELSSGQQITLHAAVQPFPSDYSFPLPLLSCVGGKYTTMLDCLDEVVRFCQTLKQMYEL